MPAFGAYDALAPVLADDYVLVKDVHDTVDTGIGAGPLAKTKRVTMATLGAAMVSLFGMQRAFDVVIAPSNASAQFKAASDVVLTGTGDQTAINTALAALPGLGRALIGPGTVSISDKIILDQSNCELHGCGWATYIQAAASFNASAAALIHVGTDSVLTGVVIEGMQLDGNYGVASGTAVGLLASAAEIRVARTEIKNATGDAYYFQAFDGSTLMDEIFLEDCYAFQPNGYGIHFGTTTENSELLRVFAVGSNQEETPRGSDGIYLEGNNIKLDMCHPYFNVGNGLTIAPGCGNHRIIDGEFETNGGFGIALGDGFYRVAIIGPVFYANAGKSIAVDGESEATDLIISGCSFFDIGTSVDADKICYVSGVSGVSIVGNTFDLTGATSAFAAISLETVDGAMVTGNTFKLASSSQYSVYGSAATKCVVEGNYLDYAVFEDTGCDLNAFVHNRWRNMATTPVTIVGASSVALDNLPVADHRASPALVTVTASMTITAPPGGYLALTTATARTALVLTAGSFNGQQITLVNQGTASLTWAASGTSHVANGATGVIAAGTAAVYVWDSNNSLWYRAGTGV